MAVKTVEKMAAQNFDLKKTLIGYNLAIGSNLNCMCKIKFLKYILKISKIAAKMAAQNLNCLLLSHL